MSTLTQIKFHSSTKTTTISGWRGSPRELHHIEESHEGRASHCTPCDRFDDAAYNGYVNGIADRYDEVGQFLDSIHDSIGAIR